jgi:polysaccharide export outer membrane protein
MTSASRTFRSVVVCWSAMLAIVVPARAQSATASAPEVAPLAPGDAIRTTFWREPQLNGEYRVDETGTVMLPLLGARSVRDIVPARLKTELVNEYGRQLRSPDDVQIVLLRRVRVLGAVKTPGLYLVDPTMTLGDLIALAGGATQTGKLKDIRVTRNGREIRSDLNERSPVGERLGSGDQILVPERSWFSRQGVFLLAGSLSAITVLVTQVVKR